MEYILLDPTYRNHISIYRQFKTCVLHGYVLSSTLFDIYTADMPPPRAPFHVMSYADDITIIFPHTRTSTAKKYIPPCLNKVLAWTKHKNLILNPDKTTCTLFTPDPAEYTSNLELKTLHYTWQRTQGSGSYLRLKTHIQRTHSIELGWILDFK